MSFPVTLAPRKLPTQEDLPYADDVPTDSWDADLQVDLLVSTLYLSRHGSESCIGASQFVYYEDPPPANVPPRKLSPDLFVVLHATPGLRRSWLRWQEGGRLPSFVLELLSESTEARDFGEKKHIYEQVWGLEDYVLYDPVDTRLEVFHRVRGRLVPLHPDAAGRYWLASLGLYLVRWTGTYRGFDREWVRFADATGILLPTPEERAAHEAELRADAMAQSREANDRRLMAEVERVAAVAQAREEAMLRAAAEARIREQATLRGAAEAQAREETTLRAAAEARVREMERQLSDMLARLDQSR